MDLTLAPLSCFDKVGFHTFDRINQTTARVGPQHKASFLSVTNPLTNVSAVKLAEDRDDALVVRVNNPSDIAIDVTLTLLRPIKKAWLCDMNEAPIEELAIQNNSVSVKLAPFKIVTILAES